MDTPPQEDPVTTDNPNDTGADEMDPFSEFINDTVDDTLNTSGVELNVDFAENLLDESDFHIPHAELLNVTEPMAISSTFQDLENPDTALISSDPDPFNTEPASASAVINLSGGDLLGASNSNDFAEARRRRREKARRSTNKPPPANTEIIDLDSLQVKGTYIKTEGGDDEDVKFIKAEPGVNYPASGFIRWPNTKDQPICLDDDDDDDDLPPPGPSSAPKVQQTAKKNEKKSPSPHLEDVPMRDVPAQDVVAQDMVTPDVDAPLDESETVQPMLTEDHPDEDAAPIMPMDVEPAEDTPSFHATTSDARSGDEMEIESATGSNNGNSLDENRATASNTSTSGPNLGRSTLTPRNGPLAKHRVMSADMRDKLKQVQKKAAINTQRGQKKVSSDGASSVLGPPAGSASSLLALPVQPANPETSSAAAGPSAPPISAVTTANSSAPRAPAPESPACLAGPSAQHLDNDSSIQDIAAEFAESDADMRDRFLNDGYSNEYLDACQELKDKRRAYRARGEKDEVAEIELMKEQADLDGWRKRLEEDKQYDQAPEDDSLFVQGNSYEGELEALVSYNSSVSGQLLESELQAKPRGRTGGASGRKGRGGKNKVGKPSKSKNNNDKIKDKAAKVSKKGAKGKKGTGGPSNVNNGMLDIGSLFTSDVFRAAQANQGQRQLPAMDSTRREAALKQLVASVPLEHRKMALVDKNYLNSACRDFVGRMSVRAVPGNDGWQVSGMTCVLKHHQLLGRFFSQGWFEVRSNIPIGSAFMRRRERSDDNPHGGICADQMGLGSRSTYSDYIILLC